MLFNVNNKKVTIFGFIQFNKGELTITFFVYIHKKNKQEYVGCFNCHCKITDNLAEMLQNIQDGKIFKILPMAIIIKKLRNLFKNNQEKGVNNHLGATPGQIIVVFILIIAVVVKLLIA
jgi:hypothetical protein